MSRAGGLVLAAWVSNGCDQVVLGVTDTGDGGAPEANAGDTGVPDATMDGTSPEASVEGGDAGSDGGSDTGASDTGNGGSDGGSDTGASDAGDDGSDAGCTPGTQRCASGAAVATCGADGQWGPPWPCATGICSGGACTGSTSGTASPSCAPGGAGMTNCGASGAGESCCTSQEVAGGAYERIYVLDDAGVVVSGNSPASVSGFRLDKYLVTVGRFRQFVAAWNGGSGLDGGAGYAPKQGSGKHTHLNGGAGLAIGPNADAGQTYETGWVAEDDAHLSPTTANLTTSCDVPANATWTSSPAGQESLPINCVTWEEAYAFCIWDGGVLPSQAEWLYAAVGGSQQRRYPWGSTDPGTACPGAGCEYAIYGCYYPNGSGSCAASGVSNLAPVGTAVLGPGRWGQLDLEGEVQQWNLDSLYSGPPYPTPCTDCTYQFALTDPRATMGDDWVFKGLNIEGPKAAPSGARSRVVGFRCARTP